MDLATPFQSVLAPLGVELYDVELHGGTLAVTVTKPGGIDLESLTAANRALSAWLDANDPIPSRYTLDVASPGLERKLRTAQHFASAVGERVTLREIRRDEPTRRLEGILSATTNDTLTLNDEQLGPVTVALADVERARTVFAWGGEAKPSPSRGKTTTTSKKG